MKRAGTNRGLDCQSINQPFIVLTETKFSYRYIPVWARYSPHTPLNNPGGPEGDTVTVAEKLLNTEY